MQLVQMPECGGFDLKWADSLRKAIAKKNPAAYEKLQEEYFKVIKEKGLSQNLCNYVWNVLISMSKGYGFNQSHTLAYSLVALQEMNLAYKYPIIFWNCACLISDSGGLEADEDGIYQYEENEPVWNLSDSTSIETFEDDEDDDDGEDNDEDDEVINTKKKKKKAKTTNYGKIASAIGKMAMEGITVEPPDINKSAYTFSPDPENQIIRYGMSGISKVGEEVVKNIIANRPYSSIDDFLLKIKPKKPQMINLIKAGAFDSFGDRVEIMHDYISKISDTKKRITLQNMKMLIDFNLIPDEYDMERRVYNFNKYLKKMKIDNTYYGLDNIALNFIDKNFSIDMLTPDIDTESGYKISQAKWDKIYQSYMDKIRPYVKAHNQELMAAVNNRLINDNWNKYCEGTLSKWEMDSVSFYCHEHELSKVDQKTYGCTNYFLLPDEPEIERTITIKGKAVPILKINRIMGVVLDKDKNKKKITLLTTSGVVNVKLYGEAFANYDKQISQRGADGKKHVIEKSWLARGNKVIVTGVKRDDSFIGKKYKSTPYHLVELITDIKEDGAIRTKTERIQLDE